MKNDYPTILHHKLHNNEIYRNYVLMNTYYQFTIIKNKILSRNIIPDG